MNLGLRSSPRDPLWAQVSHVSGTGSRRCTTGCAPLSGGVALVPAAGAAGGLAAVFLPAFARSFGNARPALRAQAVALRPAHQLLQNPDGLVQPRLLLL